VLSGTIFDDGRIVEVQSPVLDTLAVMELYYDDGAIEVTNQTGSDPGPENDFLILIRTIVTGIQEAIGKGQTGSAEYAATIEGASLSLGETIRLNLSQEYQLHVDNLGATATTYTMNLERAASDGQSTTFRSSQIALLPGARHSVDPNWRALDSDTLTLHVDSDGDGTTDETVTLDNEAQNSTSFEVLPNGFPSVAELAPNYPNPFSDATTIRFGLPSRLPMTLKVYDSVGRHVETLFDGTLGPGWHEVRFDGSGLASGMYFATLRSGGSTVTRPMLVVGRVSR